MNKGKKAGSDPTYQNLVTTPLDRAHNEDIMGLQDKDGDDEDNVPIDPSNSAELLQEVLTAVEKVNPLWFVQKYD
jgi:hypothetical protein